MEAYEYVVKNNQNETYMESYYGGRCDLSIRSTH